jgi:hypothetical protein
MHSAHRGFEKALDRIYKIFQDNKIPATSAARAVFSVQSRENATL